jgi:hypothetical protein
MAIVLDGNLGITTPAETVQGALTTTGNTILGDATTDTLTVGVTGIVKDASGNVGIGTASPSYKLHIGAAGNAFSFGSTTSSSAYNAGLINNLGGSIYFGVDNSAGTAFNGAAYAGVIGTSNATPFEIFTNNVVQASITSAGLFQFNSGYGSAATAYGCRAWVNFNGTGTVAIRASGNVSSITDNGTGDYTVNFTTAMTDVNYVMTGTSGEGNTAFQAMCSNYNVAAPTTSAMRIQTTNSANVVDRPYNNIAVFR